MEFMVNLLNAKCSWSCKASPNHVATPPPINAALCCFIQNALLSLIKHDDNAVSGTIHTQNSSTIFIK